MAPRARRLSRTYVGRASELRLASWERRFRTRSAWLAMHGGEISEGVRGSRGDPPGGAGVGALPGHVRRRGVGNRSGASTSEPGSFWPTCTCSRRPGHERLRQTLWVRADAELWSGRPRESLAAANELFERFPARGVSLCTRDSRLGLAWNSISIPVEPVIIPPIRLLAGVRPELDALRASRRRRGRGRCAAVSRCGGQHGRCQHERGRLRCAWAEGEALRRAGRGERSPGAAVARRVADRVLRPGAAAGPGTAIVTSTRAPPGPRPAGPDHTASAPARQRFSLSSPTA